jgi:exopolyphosphatase/guanosine-5'-triphosphate,3'-diphosphate pyrophosphatase
MRKLAAIDVGSNTLRLLIDDQAASGPFRPVQVERRITRLGQNFLPTKTLQPEAVERSIGALKEYVDFMQEKGVSGYLAGATAVVREAGNGKEFLRMVKDQLGLEVRILSEQEEARLSLLGVKSVIPTAEASTIVFDIGGGSTELIWSSEGGSGEVGTRSLPLGVVHLTEGFLKRDPPGAEACGRLRRQVSGALPQMLFPEDGVDRLWIGTAGTVTTLASMFLQLQKYQPEMINGTILDRSWLTELCDQLADLPIVQRSKLPGLEPGREDIILAGGLLTLEMMDTFGFTRFTVSDAGLLEGLFLELCQTL